MVVAAEDMEVVAGGVIHPQNLLIAGIGGREIRNQVVAGVQQRIDIGQRKCVEQNLAGWIDGRRRNDAIAAAIALAAAAGIRGNRPVRIAVRRIRQVHIPDVAEVSIAHAVPARAR